MTNTIVRLVLQLLRTRVRFRIHVQRGENRKLVVGEGWEVIEVSNVDPEIVRKNDWHGHGDTRCPECQQEPVTCVWEMWGKDTENDHRHIDYFWCSNAHMWIVTESLHDQVLAGHWD